jgi:transposase-like protein
MERIPKSQVLRKALQEVATGAVIEGHPMDEFFKRAIALVMQELLEQEVTDFLGRGHYERSEDSRHGYRNGYEPRSLKTAEGKTAIFIPQF